jgi:hypothetical protein
MKRIGPQRYEFKHQGHTWEIRRDFSSKRWHGECFTMPGKMVDSPRLSCVEYDIVNGYFVDCACAGIY